MFSFLGAGKEYPGDIQVTSAAWLLAAVVLVLIVRAWARNRAHLQWVQQLRNAFRVGLWNVGLWCFFFSAFAISSQPPTVLRWLWLAEAPFDFVRSVCQFVLWHIFGVIGVSDPVQFFNGSSAWHALPIVIVIGLANETALLIVAVFATGILYKYMRSPQRPGLSGRRHR